MSTTNPAPTSPPPTPAPRRWKKRLVIPLGVLGVLLILLAIAYVRGTWADSEPRDPKGTAEGILCRLYQPPQDTWQVHNDVTLNLGVDVAIPEEYISDMGQRLRTYKRVSSARDEATLASIRTETEDRYGRIPASVDRLFAYARLRKLSEELGIVSIDKTPDGAAIKFNEKARISPEKLGDYVARHEGTVFTPNGVLRLVLTEDQQDNVLDVVRDVLLQLRTTD